MPWSWIGWTKGHTAGMTKLALTVYSKNSAPAGVSFSTIPVPPKSDADRESAYESFPGMYWNLLASGQDKMSGPVFKGSGQRRAVCMTTTHKDTGKGITVYCLAFGGTVNATFVGDPTELDTFYKIIADAQ